MFYNFKNDTDGAVEMSVYGEIISGTDKWDESDVTFKDLQDSINAVPKNGTLNMYINSPGGSVFTTQAMISMINRAKQSNNIKVNAYIDGLAASCASWLVMVADNVYCYSGSVLMVHKPMAYAYGNANDLQTQIDILNKLENETIIPAYMNKAKKTEEEVKKAINDETWLSADEMIEMFNIEKLEDEKQLTACASKEVFNKYKYKNAPKELLEKENKEDQEEKIKKEIEMAIDEAEVYSSFNI